ncbi:MAG: helix-turn-helix domain-containing protein [Lachnospiraceae bacterium]|nr:helix-turn-helix domain-containing protein [Lachnospiraceae bacterium]
MYKIMLADDEGIVIDSLRFIIDKSFEGLFEVETAKTGRQVIELAESFKPDIAFMDIQMPGINGIEAMKEIKRFNSGIIFIVLSAYDKFDYAKEAIGLGVLEYLNKPFTREMIETVLKRAMDKIRHERENRRRELLIREKIETVTPVIESGFIYSVLFQENYAEDARKYKELLSIEEEYGYMLVAAGGEEDDGNELSNPVGSGIKLQKHYTKIREIIKSKLNCVIGPLLSNKIICFIPVSENETEYEKRIAIIEKCEIMRHELEERTGVKFKIGIGGIESLPELPDSYRQALEALRFSKQGVAHARDLSVGCAYEPDYPVEIEKKLFLAVESGNLKETKECADSFFTWMEQTYPERLTDIKLKCLEFVLWAERLAYLSGGMLYVFTYRSDYLPTITGFSDMNEVRLWFVEKLKEAAANVTCKKEEKIVSVISQARQYIEKNYSRDISLDDVANSVDVSPYYFSRMFKEETGETFIEYLTRTRIDHAKELIMDPRMPIGEIGQAVGYVDPNYFSRIFKKTVGVTPREYRNR